MLPCIGMYVLLWAWMFGLSRAGCGGLGGSLRYRDLDFSAALGNDRGRSMCIIKDTRAGGLGRGAEH